MQASKNGFYYVIDRLNGEFISAQPFSKVTWAKGIDQKTGRPIVNPEARYGTEAVQVFPGGGGAHNWSPMAYNPDAGLVYIPTSTNNSFVYAAQPVFDPQPGVGRMNGTVRPAPPPPAREPPPFIGPEPIEGPGSTGALVAWDPVTQQMRWRRPGGGGGGGGVLTTAGNLVFQSINDGRLVVYNATSGDKVFELNTGLRGMGPPITYQLDGKQYVALMAGTGIAVAGENGSGDGRARVTPKLMTFVLDGTRESTQ
jgi:glucose dehydrogenase